MENGYLGTYSDTPGLASLTTPFDRKYLLLSARVPAETICPLIYTHMHILVTLQLQLDRFSTTFRGSGKYSVIQTSPDTDWESVGKKLQRERIQPWTIHRAHHGPNESYSYSVLGYAYECCFCRVCIFLMSFKVSAWSDHCCSSLQPELDCEQSCNFFK